jgi:alkane 1-monooxygenase
MNYPDFPRLHVESHHRHVAAAVDDHSAPKDLTFYRFFARYLAGELGSLPNDRQRSRTIMLAILQVLLMTGIVLVGGLCALLVFGVTTFLSRAVIALVNYVQHYGLERAPGQKVGVDHAWDLPYKSGNWFYFNAGFHADHHIKASIDPGGLALRSTRFVLPYDIPIILALALVPPLFFWRMNPILTGHGGLARSSRSISYVAP